MRYEIQLQDIKWAFQETGTGILNVAQGEVTALHPIVCQEFNFEEIQEKTAIKILGDFKPSPLVQANYNFVVHLAKFMAYLQKDVYIKVANWLNKTKIDISQLVLFKTMLSESIRQNLFLEHMLGSYEEHPAIYSNTAKLFDELPDDLDMFARTWYASTTSFHTRVVGFKYKMHRFIKNVNGEERLTIKSGDTVFVIRE